MTKKQNNSGDSSMNGRAETRERQATGTRGGDWPPRLDDLDRRLLGLLQRNGRATSVELARRLGLSPPGLQRRMRRLEAAGVIRGYAALVDRAGYGEVDHLGARQQLDCHPVRRNQFSLFRIFFHYRSIPLQKQVCSIPYQPYRGMP